MITLVIFQFELTPEIWSFGTQNFRSRACSSLENQPKSTPLLLLRLTRAPPPQNPGRACGLAGSARGYAAAARGCARLVPLAPAGGAKKEGRENLSGERREI